MWNWLQRDISIDRSHVDMLRQIRVIKESDDVVLSKPGRTSGVIPETGEGEEAEDWTQLGKGQGETEQGMEVEA